MTRNKAAWFWMGYVAVGIGADVYLLRKGRFDDTATHHGRKAFGVYPAKSARRKVAGQVAVIGTCAWVANHFAFGPHSDGRLHRLVVDALARPEQTDA